MASPQVHGRAPALPLALIAQANPKLTRHDLEALTERLTDRLDELDPDTDLEDNDPAGQCDEHGLNTGSMASRCLDDTTRCLDDRSATRQADVLTTH
jgi:hypothetical protein